MIGPILYRRQFCFLLASTWRHYSDASSFLCFFTQKFVGGLIPQSPPPPRAGTDTDTFSPCSRFKYGDPGSGYRSPGSPIPDKHQGAPGVNIWRQGSTDGARGQQMAPGVMATTWSLLHVYTVHRKGNYQCRDLGLIGSFLGGILGIDSPGGNL